MSLGGYYRTKLNLYPSMERSFDGSPSSKGLAIHNATTPSEKIDHLWKSLPLSRVVVQTQGRHGFEALSFGRRKFRRGTARMCFVRHVALWQK